MSVYDVTRDIGRLETAIAGGDLEHIDEILESCVWDNLHPIHSTSMIKSFVMVLAAKIRRILCVYEIDADIEEHSLYPENFNNIRSFYFALHETVRQVTVLVANSGHQYPPHIYQAMLYIRDHIAADISLKEIADFVYMSPSHFSRSFSSCVGKGLSAYIRQERMKRAATLLCETNMTCMEAAVAVGIHSSSYFFRIFREEFGITPQEHRSLYRKNHIEQ